MGAIVFYLLMLQRYINSKQKILKKKKHPLCSGNILGDFSANNMNECVYDFSVDCKAFDISDITNIHKYLMKKQDVKYCLG